jgi:Ca-activated chloride channel family protein
LKNKISFLIMALVFVLTLTACSLDTAQPVPAKNQLTILSGSENKTLEPLIAVFEKANDVKINMVYKGSVDSMQELQTNQSSYDGVWLANSIWISLGDKAHKVKSIKSTMSSPVVFGIKKSIAQSLDFVGKDVKMKQIEQAVEQKKLKFVMTSASQSNSGASAYFGFLYAMLGNPETITIDDLHKPEVKKGVTTLLSGVNRSSGSSEWLKDLYLASSDKYDAVVNYESNIITINQQLVSQGMEPLYAVYPVDGTSIADYPLGYISNGDTTKEAIFTKFQEYILSDATQKELLKLGRRTGYGGEVSNSDATVFNKDWGIDVNKTITPIRFPATDVILEALNLYQTEFKKPSYTIFALDISPSMDGQRLIDMKSAMNALLDQEKAKSYLLQAGEEDVISIIPFSGTPAPMMTAKGKTEINQLAEKVNNLQLAEGTDIYSPVISAINILKTIDAEKYSISVVMMTDGESNVGANFSDLQKAWKAIGKDIPVFPISFGNASDTQLNQISNLTVGRTFDGKKDIIGAFKQVRGYN